MKLLVGSALFLALLALALFFGAGYIITTPLPSLRAATFGATVDVGNVLGTAGAFIGASESLIGAIATLAAAYLIGYRQCLVQQRPEMHTSRPVNLPLAQSQRFGRGSGFRAARGSDRFRSGAADRT